MKGWYGQKQRHKLASKGISTTQQYGGINKGNLVNYIIDYEDGTLSAMETLKLFAYLIKTGQVWSLQGHYGRVATHLMNINYIDKDGNITEIGKKAIEDFEMGAEGKKKNTINKKWVARYSIDMYDEVKVPIIRKHLKGIALVETHHSPYVGQRGINIITSSKEDMKMALRKLHDLIDWIDETDINDAERY